MNQIFVNNALSHGDEGKKWLNRIPDIIRNAERLWSIKVNPPFNLNYNYVAPAIRKNGAQVVLKIGFPEDREFQTEIDALSVFNGDGITKLFETDQKQATILIEKIIPGKPLSTIENDEEATRILASIILKLRKPLPPNHKFITVREWMKELKEYIQKNNRRGPLPWNLIEKANKTFEELLSTSKPEVLLHGDLHHDNVLSSSRDKWLAIDPKGIAAEPEYETAAMIRNPFEKMKNTKNLSEILQKRIMILAEELGFDPIRIHQWCFAQSVLSAVWNETSTKGPQHAIVIAEILDSINM